LIALLEARLVLQPVRAGARHLGPEIAAGALL
jgi:hypothetical protein